MSITPGNWAATSDFGWQVDEPNAVYAGPTERPNTPTVLKIASGIDNPDDARLIAAAPAMLKTLRTMIVISEKDHDVLLAVVKNMKHLVAAIEGKPSDS